MQKNYSSIFRYFLHNSVLSGVCHTVSSSVLQLSKINGQFPLSAAYSMPRNDEVTLIGYLGPMVSWCEQHDKRRNMNSIWTRKRLGCFIDQTPVNFGHWAPFSRTASCAKSSETQLDVSCILKVYRRGNSGHLWRLECILGSSWNFTANQCVCVMCGPSRNPSTPGPFALVLPPS